MAPNYRLCWTTMSCHPGCCFRFWSRRRPGIEPEKRAPHPSFQTASRLRGPTTREDLWAKAMRTVLSNGVALASEDTFEQMKTCMAYEPSLGSILPDRSRLQSHRTSSKPSSSSRLPWTDVFGWATRTSSYLCTAHPSCQCPSESRKLGGREGEARCRVILHEAHLTFLWKI
jgi:hypothetical protein